MLSSMTSEDTQDVALNGFRQPDISTLNGGIKGLRIGVVRSFYEGDPDVDDEV